MYNGAGYNRLPYNRDVKIDIYFSAKAVGAGLLSGLLALDMQMGASAVGGGAAVADFVRDISAQALTIGMASMSGDFIRDMRQSAKMVGLGTLKARMRTTHVETIVINGTFGPGRKLVIDAHKKLVKLDGQLIGYEGDFFKLHPGQNAVTYTDSTSGRIVHCRIYYRDRHL